MTVGIGKIVERRPEKLEEMAMVIQSSTGMILMLT
jgi:hypothetical protein